MSESKQQWTPGPWEWVGRDLESKHPDHFVPVIETGVDCGSFCYGGSVDLKISDANAKLIAAAPELVEALRDSLIMIGRLKKHCQITDNAGYTADGRMLTLTAVEDSARAALAKAGAA